MEKNYYDKYRSAYCENKAIADISQYASIFLYL